MQLQFTEQFQIKSKFRNEWQNRTITLCFINRTLTIGQPGRKQAKCFPFDNITILQKNSHQLVLRVGSGREYRIRGQFMADLVDRIVSFGLVTSFAHFVEPTISNPKIIDYHANQALLKENTELTSTSSGSDKFSKRDYQQEEKEKEQKNENIKDDKKKDERVEIQNRRLKSYLKQEDWIINEDGGLSLINQQKKKNQGKIIKFVMSKFISTGSLMGISFPVFAMKPQSILETYCKSFGAAPLIFSNIQSNPIERLKKFVCFIFSLSRLFADIDKPFNPTIGQTLQRRINGCSFSAEQTSHHPPQSSIFLEGKGYIIHATLELIADIGLNSATGFIQGDIHVVFEDGHRLVGRTIPGEMSGFVFGQNRFKPTGSAYIYDPTNKIICNYKNTQNTTFIGHITTLPPTHPQFFPKSFPSPSPSPSSTTTILSTMQADWSKSIKFDGTTYIDFHDEKWLPYQPSCQFNNFILPSDSCYRNDIAKRAIGLVQEAQKIKEDIQELERYFRKLRGGRMGVRS